MMAGFDYASGDIIISMDGDMQNDPDDIPRLVNKIMEGYDVCSGWRKERKDQFFRRRIPSTIANKLISWISGVKLHDYGCTLKAYKKEIIKGIKLYGEMHRFIPIYASWQGAKIAEIPVNHFHRMHGKSKYGMERTFKVILDLMVLMFFSTLSNKPIYIFGGFGIISILSAFLSFFVMIYYKFWGGKSFIETPLPQLVVLFFLVGFISILMGFIAEILMRTYYESQGKPVYSIRKTENMEK
jgi:glycosyltransferase involved in cell wall biosynthesis